MSLWQRRRWIGPSTGAPDSAAGSTLRFTPTKRLLQNYIYTEHPGILVSLIPLSSASRGRCWKFHPEIAERDAKVGILRINS